MVIQQKKSWNGDTPGPVELIGWLEKGNKGDSLSILWKRNTQTLFYLEKNLWWSWCLERIMLHWVRMKSCSVVCHNWLETKREKSEISVWYFGVTNDQGESDLAALWLVRLDQIRFAEITLSRNSLHTPKWKFLNWLKENDRDHELIFYPTIKRGLWGGGDGIK